MRASVLLVLFLDRALRAAVVSAAGSVEVAQALLLLLLLLLDVDAEDAASRMLVQLFTTNDCIFCCVEEKRVCALLLYIFISGLVLVLAGSTAELHLCGFFFLSNERASLSVGLGLDLLRNEKHSLLAFNRFSF